MHIRDRLHRPCAATAAALLLTVSSLVGGPGSPAAATTPPHIDPGALIRSAPRAPLQPTEQRHFCTSGTITRPVAEPGAAQAMMNLPQAWRFSRGAGQRVAVIDTGVSPHPRLGRVVAGGDYVSTGTGLEDCDAHGTLVAGIIAARPSADDGFAGVAPDSTIIAIRQSSGAFAARVDRRTTGDPDPTVGSSGYGSVRTLAHAIVHAVDDLRATVINISLVACSPSAAKLDDPALGAAIKHAYDRNVVVVVAAGNVEREGACRPQNPAPAGNDPTGWRSLRTIPSPAWFAPHVLAVAAVQAPTGAPADFSLHGPWVSVAAPGTGIVSLDSRPGARGLVSAQSSPTGPLSLIGTSFAAPYVSGTVALVRARFPGLDARAVMDRIIRTAHAPGTGHDDQIGYGVIDPVAALTAVLPGSAVNPNSPRAIAAPAIEPAPDDGPRNAALVGVAICAVVMAAALGVSYPYRRIKRLDPEDY